MSKMTPKEMATQIGGGLLSFPVTPFKADFSFDEVQYRENLDWLCGYDVAGLFAAGGTGEFFSLTPGEVGRIVSVAVAETKGRVPVLAGAGYGTAIACEMAVSAEKAGADGLLLLPPYLMNSEQDGLAAHVEAVCASTKLGVIFYNRDNAMLNEATLDELCQRCPNLVGYKDGVGDVELMTRVYARMGDRLTYVGGLPTAETFALPYLEMGVTTYSSAVFNFVPEFACDFYAAVRRQDRKKVYAGLRDFILPLIAIRNRKKGYAVSIIKAGMKVVGRDSGPVRSPLTDLTAPEIAELEALVNGLVAKKKAA
jgi:5-dehydro-4-deoxyglucarate dehydratase